MALISKILHKKYFWIALIIAGLLIKIPFFPVKNGDYRDFLVHWVDFIREYGYFASLKYRFHNYTPAYMYILVFIVKSGLYPLYTIKVVSILFEYLVAFFIGKIVCLKYKNKLYMLVCLAIIPIIPTVFMNSLLFSQCDSIYSAFAIGSVYFLLNKRPWTSALFLAFSFMFKLQSLFLLPFFFIMMLKNHIKYYHFIIIPLVYVISIIPANIVGRPFNELMNIYLMQADFYSKLTMNFPNIYVFISNNYAYIAKPAGIIISVFFTLIIGWYFYRDKTDLSFENKIRLVFASAVIVPFILPGMHDRYMYLADVLGVTYFLIIRKRIFIPLSALLVSTYAYIRFFLSYRYLHLSPAAILYFFVIIWIFEDFVDNYLHNKTKSTIFVADNCEIKDEKS
ncbi:MAG: hypothetical protein LBR13_02740 [Dysgonamonadaceae bacterium]|jgi:Gpi18-like mannosyltransferase|nr:hypothetical protein [Dysgonamonadaceae bacterium]